jgi:hypothetical protein
LKTARIVVCVVPEEKNEIEQWAECEGRTASNYLHRLHIDYVRRAKAEGLPHPQDVEVE